MILSLINLMDMDIIAKIALQYNRRGKSDSEPRLSTNMWQEFSNIYIDYI